VLIFALYIKGIFSTIVNATLRRPTLH